MFPHFPQISVKSIWRDITDTGWRRQDGCIHEVSSPGPGEEVFLFPLGWVVENCGKIDRGGENIPEVIVRVEHHLVSVDVVSGHVAGVVHLTMIVCQIFLIVQIFSTCDTPTPGHAEQMLFSPYVQMYEPPSTDAWLLERWLMNWTLDLYILLCSHNLHWNSASCLSEIFRFFRLDSDDEDETWGTGLCIVTKTDSYSTSLLLLYI